MEGAGTNVGDPLIVLGDSALSEGVAEMGDALDGVLVLMGVGLDPGVALDGLSLLSLVGVGLPCVGVVPLMDVGLSVVGVVPLIGVGLASDGALPSDGVGNSIELGVLTLNGGVGVVSGDAFTLLGVSIELGESANEGDKSAGLSLELGNVVGDTEEAGEEVSLGLLSMMLGDSLGNRSLGESSSDGDGIWLNEEGSSTEGD